MEQRDRIVLAERDIGDLTAARDAANRSAAELAAEQAALSRALAAARDEIDEQAEAARLAAARREALEALTERLRSEAGEQTGRIAALESDLSAAEAARQTEAAAAEGLRRRLQDADADLSVLSLAMEEERRQAEATLLLLAGAEAANRDLTDRLAEAVAAREAAGQDRDAAQAGLETALSQQEAQSRELAAISDALDAAKAARLRAEAEAEALRASAGEEQDDLRQQLEKALALRLAAEAQAAQALDQAEREAILLQTARRELAGREVAGAEDRDRMAALTAQVRALRRDVSTLRSLLDVAQEDAQQGDEEIAALGQKLNAALLREAQEQKRRAELEAAERARLENYQSEFFGRMREVLGDREGVEIVGDRFVFDSEVLFPSGSAQLSEEGRQQVRRVAALLDEVSSEIPEGIDWVIRVDGHTDDVPISAGSPFADNWELSQARALSVVRFMSEDLGFPARRLAPTGFGQFRPVDPGQTPEARARNRRIEMKVTER